MNALKKSVFALLLVLACAVASPLPLFAAAAPQKGEVEILKERVEKLDGKIDALKEREADSAKQTIGVVAELRGQLNEQQKSIDRYFVIITLIVGIAGLIVGFIAIFAGFYSKQTTDAAKQQMKEELGRVKELREEIKEHEKRANATADDIETKKHRADDALNHILEKETTSFEGGVKQAEKLQKIDKEKTALPPERLAAIRSIHKEFKTAISA